MSYQLLTDLSGARREPEPLTERETRYAENIVASLKPYELEDVRVYDTWLRYMVDTMFNDGAYHDFPSMHEMGRAVQAVRHFRRHGTYES